MRVFRIHYELEEESLFRQLLRMRKVVAARIEDVAVWSKLCFEQGCKNILQITVYI